MLLAVFLQPMKTMLLSLFLVLSLCTAYAQRGFLSHIGGSYDIGSIVGYPAPTYTTDSWGNRFYPNGFEPYDKVRRWKMKRITLYYHFPLRIARQSFEGNIGISPARYWWDEWDNGQSGPYFTPSRVMVGSSALFLTSSMYKHWRFHPNSHFAITTGVTLGGSLVDFTMRAVTPSYGLQADMGVTWLQPKWSASLSGVIGQTHFREGAYMYRYFTTNSLRLTLQGRANMK